MLLCVPMRAYHAGALVRLVLMPVGCRTQRCIVYTTTMLVVNALQYYMAIQCHARMKRVGRVRMQGYIL